MAMAANAPSAVEPGGEEATVRVLVEQLSPRYAPVLGEALVEDTVRAALAELRARARLQQFVPLLAHRLASDRLRDAEKQLAQYEDGRLSK